MDAGTSIGIIFRKKELSAPHPNYNVIILRNIHKIVADEKVL